MGNNPFDLTNMFSEEVIIHGNVTHPGVVLVDVANPRALLLFSNTVECMTVGDANSIFKWVLTSCINRLKVSRLLLFLERGIYSVSKVERAIYVKPLIPNTMYILQES